MLLFSDSSSVSENLPTSNSLPTDMTTASVDISSDSSVTTTKEPQKTKQKTFTTELPTTYDYVSTLAPIVGGVTGLSSKCILMVMINYDND
jgi:hypothetical protein